jgi:hypothetical protein
MDGRLTELGLDWIEEYWLMLWNAKCCYEMSMEENRRDQQELILSNHEDADASAVAIPHHGPSNTTPSSTNRRWKYGSINALAY